MNRLSVLSELIEATDDSAVFFANGIGDCVLALPTLRALTWRFPNKLGLITAEKAPLFLFRDLAFRSIDTISIRGSNEGHQVSVQSNPAAASVLFSIVPWTNASLESLFGRLGVRLLVSHFKADVQIQFTEHLHAFDMPFTFTSILDSSLDIEAFSQSIRFSEESIQFARELRSCSLGARPIATLHLDTHPGKMLPEPLGRLLVERLATQFPAIQFLLIGSERLTAMAVPCDIVYVLECTDLEYVMAAVAESDFFVGYDSCFLHVADICDVPGVGLFISTEPGEFGFRFQKESINLHLREKGAREVLSEVTQAVKQICRFSSFDQTTL